MWNILMENAGTIIVSLILIGVCALILVRLYRNGKQGKSSCGCGCGSCPMSSACCRKKGHEGLNQ